MLFSRDEEASPLSLALVLFCCFFFKKKIKTTQDFIKK